MLEKFGVRHAGLKWPNDVLCRGRKLAGILIELKGEAAGPCHIVLGVGINVVASESMDSQIDQPWTDLTTVVGHAVSRNAILAVLIAELFAMLIRYKNQGFAGFINEWRKYDLIRKRLVRLRLPGGDIIGQVRGVDDNGALLLSVNGSVRRYLSGDVSLRPVG
jgi:BirA family biotin operon repressor/biotin-[acetyl-CoA-carboxylase] ligase